MSTDTTDAAEAKTPKPQSIRQQSHSSNRQGSTRQDQLLRQLRRKTGTDVPTLCKTFGWQPHTARAALSMLRKAGHDVVRDPATNGKPARYRVVATLDHLRTAAPASETVINAG